MMAQSTPGPIEPQPLPGRLPTELASESLAWSILNWLPDAAVAVFDADLRVLAAAGEALARRGVDRDRVVGRLLPDLLPPEIYESYGAHCRGALAGEVSTLERKTRDGERVFRIEFSPLRSEDGSVVAGIAASRDLTEQRAAEAAREEARELFETAFSAAPLGVALIGLDGRFIRVNGALCEMLGRSEDELVGSTSRSLTHPDDLEATARAFAHLTQNGSPISVQKRYLRPDGEVVWAATRGTTVTRPDGEPSHIVSHFQDITATKQAEQLSVQAHRRFETAFADAPIGMALVAPDGQFIRVNRTLCDLVGYSEEQLSDLTFQAITHPDDLDADLDHVGRLLDGEADRYTMEKRYVTAQGRPIWVNLSVSIVRDDAGQPLHFISQLEDISERKRLQESLQHLADHDPLTELWNRRRFEEELRRQIDRCQRYKERATLLILDLNGFKPINDTYGHKAGDELLQGIADALRRRLRVTDCIGRLGGDEFAVILANVSPDRAARTAVDLKAAVALSCVSAGTVPVAVTASVGLAAIDEDTVEPADVLHRADLAMYAAKPDSGPSLPREELAVPDPVA
jgi:diguanylate cyclase (GGDEF)-like protein/PAS domain S-box-containing protein